MNSIRVALISSLGATLTAGCATGAPPANVSSTPPNIGRALQEVDASDFLKHIETLASDDFEGRSVGARGEAVTVDYLVGEFKRIGLMPGNPDGSYIQRVPLTEHTSAPSAIIKAGATRLDLKFPDDFVAWLEDALATAAASQGRVTRPDAHSEKGFFYRADHFEFAKVGVPPLFVFGGADYIGQPGDFGEKKFNDYVAHDYHKVTDVVRPDWNLSGAVENMRLLFQVGYDVAQGARYPEWKAGAEFKARRDEMMGRPH
jgi:pimeloyl-ACP methyl ester carboxylesterase